MIKAEHHRLQGLVKAIFTAAGSEEAEAECVSQHLVQANLSGHDSHGVIRTTKYMQWLREQRVVVNQHAQVVWESDVLAIVEGNMGYGQVIGAEAVRLGVDKCDNQGVALVALRGAAHLGRIGHWAEMAAEAGLISLHFVSTNGFGVLVAPHGGIERRLSANPMAAGIPGQDAEPIILDISTCAIAEGKILVAKNKGVTVPQGCILDAEGQPTEDPQRFYADPPGTILPMGQHKGYGLSLMVELLAGALTGNGCSQQRGSRLEQGMLSIYLDPARVERGGGFHAEASEFVRWVKSSRTATPDGQILLPGEVESRNRARRMADGIELDDTTWQQLVAEAQQLGVSSDWITSVANN